MHWMQWSGGGWLMMVFWWILLIGVIYLIIRALMGWKPSESKKGSPEEILKTRYARGEISKEEFDIKMSDIINNKQGRIQQ